MQFPIMMTISPKEPTQYNNATYFEYFGCILTKTVHWSELFLKYYHLNL